MARNPMSNEVTFHDNTGAAQDSVDAVNILAVVQSDYSDERDLFNRLLAKAELAGAYENFSRTVRISQIAFIKENKLYRALKGQKSVNGSCFLGTWEEFCSLLNMSHDKADLDIQNLKAFGEEALESMNKAGIGYRELKQFRKLPEDEKTELIEVAKSGDKEALLEAAEAIIAKQQKEKESIKKQLIESQEAAKKQADNFKADQDAVQKRNADLIKEKEEMALKLAKFELKTISIEEQIEQLGLTVDLNDDIYKLVNRAFNSLNASIEHLYQLKLNAMKNDPEFQPGDIARLPDIMLDELLNYDGLIILILDRIRLIHRDFCGKFDANINELRARMRDAVHENLVELSNEIE